MPEQETVLVNKAIAGLKRATNLDAEFELAGQNGPGINGKLVIHTPARAHPYLFDIKHNVTQANLIHIANQIRNLPDKALLITRYVNPNLADKLFQLGVQFMDTAGNIYLNDPPMLIFVKGEKLPEPEYKLPAGKAFTPAGLRVVCTALQSRAGK